MKATRFAALLLLAPGLLAAQQGPDRSRPPGLGAPPRLMLPAIEKHELKNGLDVWLVEAHEVPLVQVNLVVHAGSGDDPPSQYGLASLTAAMLDEGAGARSALEIADEIEFLGAELGATSSFDASAVRLNVPVRTMTSALSIMADVALRPTFPPDELERLREERLTALLQTRNDPAAVAAAALPRVVYGDSHRYGTIAIGTTATLSAFTPQDLAAFHARKYRPTNSTLIVVGDVTASSVLPLLENAFGGWTAERAAARTAVPAAPGPRTRQVTIVDMPGAEQSAIRVGTVGVARSTPDYFALQVLNTILGGSFTSRLNQNLREEHGYAYGASSRFDMRLAPGPFVVAANVQTDKTAESLTEIFNELEAIAEPIESDELAKAKNYLALSFPAAFETIEDLAARIEELAIYGLPDSYYADYTNAIGAVTAESVQRAAAAHIDPARLSVVVVGDRSKIEAGIRALELGPVRVVGVEDVVP
ncbi:MAG TPA: pitrilysin family protein [Gammaproteobacteria bacterium]|nr:pitrilysin family protein [Gammaproteobacteria bacterium]